jgi:hypothetical protein
MEKVLGDTVNPVEEVKEQPQVPANRESRDEIEKMISGSDLNADPKEEVEDS